MSNNEVFVASLRQGTFLSQLSNERLNSESIQDYISKEINFRVNFIIEQIILATENKVNNIPLFFTLPEFFWNIKLSYLKNKDELYLLTDYMLNKISDAQEFIMGKLPENKFGKIVLLSGTLATLIETDENGLFESCNYCLIVNNFKKTKDGRFEKSVWPKRATSSIDFGIRKSITDRGFIFNIADEIEIEVLNKTSFSAGHDSIEGFGFKLDNTILNEFPFSINICLDYMALKPGDRVTEIYNKEPIIDFLISCGMELSYTYTYPNSIKYVVKNDGMDDGNVKYYSVEDNHLLYPVPAKNINKILTLTKFTF